MSVLVPAGFVASGVACGIKASGALDLALVATEDGVPVPAAAVFTSNRAAAAPVTVSRRHLQESGGYAAAVVVNSGNANAATGENGRSNAEHACALVAAGLGCLDHDVLVCSTGLIGIPLPMGPLVGGIGPLLAARAGSAEAAAAAAQAILTTDTRPKVVSVHGDGFVVGGMAKGAAMLAPNMATMLAVLTTDAELGGVVLQQALREAVSDTFNDLSVDGCTSTNDTVILLASGRAGPVSVDDLAPVLRAACAQLAWEMAADAEGATRIARIVVVGARSAEDARRAARRVAESQLVQCSLHGLDPYWGRIVSELGSSGAAFDIDRVSVSYGGVTVCLDGVAVPHDEAAVAAHMGEAVVSVHANLGLGDGRAEMVTTDLSAAYIAENMGTS